MIEPNTTSAASVKCRCAGVNDNSYGPLQKLAGPVSTTAA